MSHVRARQPHGQRVQESTVVDSTFCQQGLERRRLTPVDSAGSVCNTLTLANVRLNSDRMVCKEVLVDCETLTGKHIDLEGDGGVASSLTTAKEGAVSCRTFSAKLKLVRWTFSPGRRSLLLPSFSYSDRLHSWVTGPPTE